MEYTISNPTMIYPHLSETTLEAFEVVLANAEIFKNILNTHGDRLDPCLVNPLTGECITLADFCCVQRVLSSLEEIPGWQII